MVGTEEVTFLWCQAEEGTAVLVDAEVADDFAPPFASAEVTAIEPSKSWKRMFWCQVMRLKSVCLCVGSEWKASTSFRRRRVMHGPVTSQCNLEDKLTAFGKITNFTRLAVSGHREDGYALNMWSCRM